MYIEYMQSDKVELKLYDQLCLCKCELNILTYLIYLMCSYRVDYLIMYYINNTCKHIYIIRIKLLSCCINL